MTGASVPAAGVRGAGLQRQIRDVVAGGRRCVPEEEEEAALLRHAEEEAHRPVRSGSLATKR